MIRKAFKEDTWDKRNNAWLLTDRDWVMYALGYKKAGDILAAHMLGPGEQEMDILIYPLCFNYRQYIELSMKVIIIDGRKLLDIKDNEEWKKHSFSRLWKISKEIIDIVVPRFHREMIVEDIGGYIKQFHNVDPNSTGFRYPKDINGGNQLKDIKNGLIDVQNLRNILQIIEDNLNPVMFEIRDYLNKRWSLKESDI